MSLEKRYGILINDDEWNLLYRSVTSRRDNIKDLTGKKPDDLTALAKDLLTIKKKGYVETSNSNKVTEEDMIDRVCEDCA